MVAFFIFSISHTISTQNQFYLFFTMNQLSYFADLAYEILKTSKYAKDKLIIKKCFSDNFSDRKTTIKFRLTVIDSYYSTQMDKRLYGIEEIAEKLFEKTDEELIMEVETFLSRNKQGFINNLFTKSYGIDKKGKAKGKAISLLSKYLYFLTNYQFPIYDNLVKESYPLLLSMVDTNYKSLGESNFFDAIVELNQKSGIRNFERLDNLLWLLGKIRFGSFAILMDEVKYKVMVEKVDFSINESPDECIRKSIKEDSNQFDFTKEQKKFFEFGFSLR